ncbi:MAG: YHS domain-containing protein [SAR202 cluster bacterium]|jgi:YHS domain-containing protein|nr:YHS domain-containing protein [SAR202 cluster bacterium]MDP6301509.1 YHS domain-containing protein [SAR202 cluster bacterium]MDP7104972.1 YHS domain-containing protein [SAR202 cluster bacterium]MDP7226560.1 YHS domain-containing protein [SAR202 cluster bacterium]MDP7414778.1 YHS domain-containing protein [SAR202 cluster bacterium]
MPKDPVCGIDIDEGAARAETGQTRHGATEVDPEKGTRRFHAGKWYYFCSLDCRIKFMASPETYMEGA